MTIAAVNNLEPIQDQAIVALLTEPTFKKAAASVGIAEKTIHRWLDDPVFGSAYRKARRLAFNQAIAATQRYVPVAIQALTKITVDETAPHSARVSAATAILKFSRDSIELDDMQERIVAIEQQLSGGISGVRRQVVNEAQAGA